MAGFSVWSQTKGPAPLAVIATRVSCQQRGWTKLDIPILLSRDSITSSQAPRQNTTIW